jgi:DNA-binding response OmpR family regulator
MTLHVVLHPESGNFEIDGTLVHLTPRQWQVFDRLWRARPECVSVDALQDMLDHDADDALDSSTLRQLMLTLRRRLALSAITVVTSWGYGYCLKERAKTQDGARRRARAVGLI